MRTNLAISQLLFPICIMLPAVRSKLAPAAFMSAPSHLNIPASVVSSKINSLTVRPRFAAARNEGRIPGRPNVSEHQFPRGLSLNSVSTAEQTAQEGNIKVLYDGECPICLYEINWLQKRAKKLGVTDMEWIDVADKDYTPEKCAGITYERGMEVMHVVGKDGTIHDSVSAFEILYGAVGLTWLSKTLSNPTFQKIANPVYDYWAQFRLPLTGRPSLEVLLARRREAGCRKPE